MERKYLLLLRLGMATLLILFLTRCKDDKDAITDDAFYKTLTMTVANCYKDIYNQNLAGVSTGSHNINANGPMGGTVVITGTTGYDNNNGITTTDLVYTLSGAPYTYSYKYSEDKTFVGSVTLTGTTTSAGSFSHTYNSVSYISNNMHVVGNVTYKEVSRDIDMTGNLTINNATKTTADFFGHSVTW